MRIGLDAMGGDYAPKAIVLGAILAQKELSQEDRIVLIGERDTIISILHENGANEKDFDIIHATEVIDMHDKPIKAFTQKPHSSMAIGFNALKEGKIDSFASAGNTGAMLVGTMYSIGVLEGVMRPCLAALLPKEKGGFTLLVDVGVNPDAKPEMISQFALLGSIYAQKVLGIETPRVGLLNIGEEEEKGNAQALATLPIMKEATNYNFVGNAEPIEIFKDNIDVIACDGFNGNLVMKNTEAFARVMAKGGMINDFIKRCNYELYGGLPLLGANGVVIIGHGVSNERAIKTMVLQSKTIYDSKINEHIGKVLRNTI